MIIELSNGIQCEIKLINLAGGSVDYSRINDPVYSGDCVLYIQITSLATAEEEIKAALEVELVELKA